MEIEIKLRLENSTPFLDFLEKNAKFIEKQHQVDEYFTPIHCDFLAVKPVSEWLRLRNADGKYSINYKNWYIDTNGKGNHCEEYETGVLDIVMMNKIFSALNITSRVIVDKTRSIWHFENYDI